MKKTFYFSLLFAFVALLNSCTSSKEKAEKAVDEKMTTFFAALEKQDFETAKTLSTPATQKLLTVVMEDSKKYKEFNDKVQPIKIEIVERKVVENVADYKIRILIGEKVKEESIHCVLTNEVWFVDMPEDQISICRYVVFYDTYDTVLVLYKKKYEVRTTIIEVKTTHKDKSHKKKSHKKKKHKND